MIGSRPRRLWIVEVIAWMVLGYAASAGYWGLLEEWYFSRPGSGPTGTTMARSTLRATISIGLVASVPVVYRIVFAKLLLTEGLWPAVSNVRAWLTENEGGNGGGEDRESAALDTALRDDDAPQTVLGKLVQSSRYQSERILRRAGVYLVLGAAIAFFGVAFFYLETSVEIDVVLQADDWVATLATSAARTAPRFGVLFFVEFVAFFFLRQYRTAMEEFRYFEAIQRRREETFGLVRLMRAEESKVNIERLLEGNRWFSDSGKLAQGESTELLESKKWTKDELDIVLKIVEAMSRTKGG